MDRLETHRTPAHDRAARVEQVAEEVLARRLSGVALTDETVIAAHPDLMPELVDELHKLRRIEVGLEEVDTLVLAPGGAKPPRADGPAPAMDAFPGYLIVREIHRGGQGVVYQAIQKATKRRVAIKVMHEGRFAGPRDRARFEREVQILAALDHPNIVGILDSGVIDGTHAYFVMDYISGRPLDQWIADCRLQIADSDRGRSQIGNLKSEICNLLRLFGKICDAVNAAHLRGVIHRDLKPGNIRVDAAGEPHILDFGLARTIAPQATDGSEPQVMTVTGQFIGSLPWASPEQAEGVPAKIDLRTDVYSLGVIFYQSLAGRFPYEVTGHMSKVLENIRHAEPPRQSSLSRGVSDEVDTIVLKCLAKERERRYQSAGEVARDIARYLAGEPIEAKRDSGLYMLKKALGRYRRPLLFGGVALAVVLASSVFAFSVWRDASTRRSADRLVNRASALIASRADLADARGCLNEAVRLAPDLEEAYYQRGRLSAIEGLEALIEDKPTHVGRAVDDFMRAFVASGGELPAALVPPEPPPRRSAGRGVFEPIYSAINLVQMSGQQRTLNELLKVATSLATRRPREAVSNAAHAALPIYDPDRDLLEGVPTAVSPAELRANADTEASLRRALRTPIETLNPVRVSSLGHYVVELLFDPLFFVNAKAQCERNAGLVKSLEVRENGLVNRVELQAGPRWQDGEPVTAFDVAFAWTQLSTDDPCRRAFTAVTAVDATHVEFRRAQRVIDPEWDLTFPIIPEHWFTDYLAKNPGSAAKAHEAFGREPIGNGPYTVARKDDAEIVLQRWDDYPGSAPHFKTVRFRIIEDRAERCKALAQGNVDETELTGLDFCWYVNGESFWSPGSGGKRARKIIKVNDPGKVQYDFIGWNLRRAFFEDEQVRVALALAVDLPTISAKRFGGLYAPSTGIYTTQRLAAWMANPDIAPLQHDPERAARLFDEAGWPPGPDGVRQKAGMRLEFSLLLSELSRTEMLGVASEFAEQFRRVGVLMKVAVLPDSELTVRRRDGEFDAYFGSVIDSPHPDQSSRRWVTKGERNYIGYSNPEVDDLYRSARLVSDVNAQPEKYRRIQQIIFNEQPYLFLWRRPTLWAVRDRLRGVEISPQGLCGFYPGPRAWWVAVGD